MDWIEAEPEVFREHLTCEAVVLIVDEFSAAAEVSWATSYVKGCELRRVGIGED